MENKNFLSVYGMQKLKMAAELEACNEMTLKFGLALHPSQIENIVNKRFEALKDNGRLELGGGIIKKLVYEFCDSPYISQDNYEELLIELQDSFYYFKNMSMDMLSDDELIHYMGMYFNDCEGSVEYLNGTSLEELCRRCRNNQ